MARQKGLLKIEGTIGGMTFYESQDGSLVREKGGVSGDKIANDPTFARTRENNEEFASAGSAGKIIRDALRAFMMNAADGRVTSRLTKVMSDMLKLDTTSVRGKRSPAIGLGTDAGKALLKSFNFNVNAILGSIIFNPMELDRATGQISFTNLDPVNEVAYPVGATHVRFSSAVANIDLATGISIVEVSPPSVLILSAPPTTVGATPAAMPTGNGLVYYLLKVEFTQFMNGQHYSLKNGAYNALSIIEIV